MRKVILQMQTSIDGFVGRKDEGPDWQVWDWGPEPRWTKALLDRFNHFFAEADTLLLSRKIVEGGYVDHWTKMASRFPKDSPFAFAHRILAAQKIVFSKSGKTVDAVGVEMAARPLAKEVAALKRRQGGNIVAFGGAGFAAELIAEGLVDEYQFYVNAVALNDGLRVFRGGGDKRFSLLDATAYDCGVAVARYSPEG
jgi:dihydrofolate reductase